MKNFKKLVLAAGLVAFAGTASAVPINGAIGFAGAYTHDGDNLGNATMIMIDNATVAGDVSGSFADEGITAGDAATYSDFTFAPTGAVASIWSVGSFTFNLDQMHVDFQSNTLLGLSGGGTITSTNEGLDDTDGQWTFTANETGSNLTWSSSTATPEPAITLLLATGLIGFGVARKMRKSA